ncbi:ABC transporter ATP-binding protein [uncultured Jatrophihabitans sp.]|uniref:ABC transporter ATP-binding protein n=1 Tax=uncultured Jatrophihabitans sp. TaxID=1610747 RepID=UPI0035CC44F5
MLLEVEDLSVTFDTPDGAVKAVQNISFQLDTGQTLGIVGESGSGKSVSTQALVGLLRGADITGRSSFNGQDLLTMSPSRLRAIRGAEIAMIFQDPLSSLHPYYRVGSQITEQIRAHEDISKKAARSRAVELLRLVGIPQPDRRVDDFPHQFSGGMRQRAMIAMAMSLNPKLLIADEPTTALDVTVQAQVLEVLERLQDEFGTAIIMITHDLGVIAGMADRVCVMYAGRIVEEAPLRDIFYTQHHPYTAGLLRSIPSASSTGQRLSSIAGQPPSLVNLPSGCSFHPRCPYVFDQCRAERPLLDPVLGNPLHRSACFLPKDSLRVNDSADTFDVADSEVGAS